MSNCIFCQIAEGKLQTQFLFQDQEIVAFADINPQAPHHILLIPRKHITTLNDLTSDDINLMGKLYLTAKDLAKKLNIEQSGYRTVINCNQQGGQAVYHLHLHLLGGRQMNWPPG